MSTHYHEPSSELSAEAREMHRALASLTEELEAVDWYQQRVDVTGDDDLKAVLAHNRDEEIEHAAMTLEWLRRRVPEFDAQLRTYLFTEKQITEVEEGEESEDGGSKTPETPVEFDLGIGRFDKEDKSS